jgi:hypothetical protein
VDLFELTISILSGESGDLEKLLNSEATYSKDRLRNILKRLADAKTAVVPAIAQRLNNELHDLALISGVGHVFPFLRTQTILENLQPAMVASRPGSF